MEKVCKDLSIQSFRVSALQMNEYYVYQLRVSDEPLPFYVGKGKGNRAWHHLTPTSLSEQSFKNNRIKKAVSEDKQIIVEFIETDLSEIDAYTLEEFYISLYGRVVLCNGCLVNSTDGGIGVRGYVPYSEITSDAIKSRFKRTIECEYCGVSSEIRNHVQYHGKNCRLSPTYTPKVMPKHRCQYCGIEAATATYNRYHGEKCKLNPEAKPRIPEKKIECEFCGKVCNPGNYSQFHGKNCKASKNSFFLYIPKI